jgi:hypothetical protein
VPATEASGYASASQACNGGTAAESRNATRMSEVAASSVIDSKARLPVRE